MLSWAAAARPILRLGGAEIAPWVAVSDYYAQQSHVLAIVTGEAVPKVPEQRRFLGQTWALTRLKNNSYGVTAKVPITGRLALRAGFGYSDGGRSKNFSEFYVVAPQGEEASHRLIADPAHAIHSASGEVQLAYRFGQRALAAPADRRPAHAQPAHRNRRFACLRFRHGRDVSAFPIPSRSRSFVSARSIPGG